MYDNSNNAITGMTDAIGQLTTETSYSGGYAYTAPAEGIQRLRRVPRRDHRPPRRRGRPGRQLHPQLTPTPAPPACRSGQLTPRHPAARLPAETVTDGYTPGFDLPAGLGSNLAAYVQHTTYTAFSQVAQEKIGSTTNHAYITNTYDPHTGP